MIQYFCICQSVVDTPFKNFKYVSSNHLGDSQVAVFFYKHLFYARYNIYYFLSYILSGKIIYHMHLRLSSRLFIKKRVDW